jgi:signal transduction histidine kinase
MLLLILPDLLAYRQSLQGGPFPLKTELIGTVTDALIFGLVVYLLRRDVQRRRQAEKELQVANCELVAANQFKLHLLGMAAHDLKNPLTAIRSLASLLKNPGGDAQSVRETAEHIEATSQEMLGLIHDLLDTAALEGASLKLDRAYHHVGELVASAVETARPAAANKQQRLELELGPLAIALVDARRLRQVLQNLLGNAIKFSPVRKTIRVGWAVEGSSVMVKVTDEGPGLSSEDSAQLFQRFRPLSARPTAGESSSGLGLWIVRQLVELHGGTVSAVSRGAGHGATFCVKLPLAEDEETSEQGASPVEAAGWR